MVLSVNPLAPIQRDSTLVHEVLNIIEILYTDASVGEEVAVYPQLFTSHETFDQLISSS